MTAETQQFISEHANDDVQKLALQANRFPQIDMSFALRQISGRQKIRNKVPLFYQNNDILYPPQLSLEQASSELTALYKSTLCEGENFVDLTGGFGIDSYFMSRNFKQAIYVERSSELCDIAALNFKTLFANNINIENAACEDFLSTDFVADVFFIDPARRNLSGNKVVFLSDCEPNVVELSEKLMQKADKVLVKTSPMLDITSALRDLPVTKEVHIVSVDNECKEIILVLSKGISKNIKIKTINIQKTHHQLFDYYQNEENDASIEYCTEIKRYLYEPNSSIMKSGAFKLIAKRFNLIKLHKNTHLYTSDELISDFPGRIFEIKTVSGSTKQDFKRLNLQISKANIAVRNYPITVDEFRKKSGIRDGGDIYIFACKICDDFNAIIVCSKK